jgi:hypothetical protein
MKEPKDALIQDLVLSLGTWGVLELTCFVAMPLLRMYAFGDVDFWLGPSLAFGTIGAVMIGIASRAVVEAQSLAAPTKQRIRRIAAKFLSIMGFTGVTFPLALTLISLGNLLKTGGS